MVNDKNQQENADTLEDSPSEEKTLETESSAKDELEEGSSSPQVEKEVSEEEAEWAKLSGKSQERFKEVLRERDEWRGKASQQAQTDAQQVGQANPGYQQPAYNQYAPTQAQEPNSDEIKNAVDKLKEHGIVTKDQLQEEMNRTLSRIETDRIHNSLEEKYSGGKNLPKYDRAEVEDYARKTNNYNLEAAFKDMYFDEFMDSAKKDKAKGKVITEKPRATVDERGEPITVESLGAKLRGPKGRDYYEKLRKDPRKLDAILGELSKG